MAWGTFDRYGEWLDHDGKSVQIDGHEHILRAKAFWTSYPRQEYVVSVHAEPVDKSSRWYRQISEQLGDDWSTDIMDSDCELQSAVWLQVATD